MRRAESDLFSPYSTLGVVCSDARLEFLDFKILF